MAPTGSEPPEDGTTRATPPLSKAAYVYEELSKAIRNGELPPGSAINQEEIASRLGVSATPVREALRTLEAGGLVTYLPHRGATVATLDPKEVSELYLLRARVEGLATRLATERASEEEIEYIAELHSDLEARVTADDGNNLASLNRAFHFAIYERAQSRLLLSHIKALWSMFSPRSYDTYWTRRLRLPEFVREHGQIVEAMRARDSDAADFLMHQHIARVAVLRLNEDRQNWNVTETNTGRDSEP